MSELNIELKNFRSRVVPHTNTFSGVDYSMVMEDCWSQECYDIKLAVGSNVEAIQEMIH